MTIAMAATLPLSGVAFAGSAAAAPATTAATATSTITFADIPATYAHYTEISWVAGHGIYQGTQTGNHRRYHPNQPVSRADMAVYLYRLAGSPQFTPPPTSPFADVSTRHAAYREIAWLADRGIDTGSQAGHRTRFQPNQPLTREAAAGYLYKFEGSPEFAPPAVSPFRDVATNRAGYQAIAWLADRGILTAADGTRFRPNPPLTREAMAVFLYRLETTRPGPTPAPEPVKTPIVTRVTQGNGPSSNPQMSADGRYVVFSSLASNLVPNDENDQADVFVWDRTNGAIERITRGPSAYAPADLQAAISADGRHVVYYRPPTQTEPSGYSVYDRVSGTTAVVNTDGLQAFRSATISGDGRYVAFVATTIPDGNYRPPASFVSVWDRETGTTTQFQQARGPEGAISVSFTPDGQHIVIGSGSLWGRDSVQLLDPQSSELVQISWGDGHARTPSVSNDASNVVFSSDAPDVVAGETNAMRNIYLWEREGRQLTRLTNGDGESRLPQISGDGRYVSFVSDATNLVPGDTNNKTDLFILDREGGDLVRVTDDRFVPSTGYLVSSPAISDDGHYGAFAANTPSAGDNTWDIYTWSR